MTIAFTLSMPNRASWNGRWSGEDDFYCILKKFTTKKAKAHAEELLKVGYWHHSFGDGWAAGITAKEVDPATARKYAKKSRGFCGYNWMVDNILAHGRTDKPEPVKQ